MNKEKTIRRLKTLADQLDNDKDNDLKKIGIILNLMLGCYDAGNLETINQVFADFSGFHDALKKELLQNPKMQPVRQLIEEADRLGRSQDDDLRSIGRALCNALGFYRQGILDTMLPLFRSVTTSNQKHSPQPTTTKQNNLPESTLPKTEAGRLPKVILKRVRKLQEFKQLTRQRFRTPDGYSNFEEIAEHLGMHVLMGHLEPWKSLEEEFQGGERFLLAAELAKDPPAVYWLSKSLLEAMLRSEVPTDAFKGMERVLVKGIIMLPKGVLLFPDGDSIDFLAFRHALAGEELKLKFGNNIVAKTQPPENSLTWLTISLNREIECTGCIGLEGDTNEYRDGREDVEHSQEEIANACKSVLLQCLLMMQMRPEMVEGTPTASRKKARRGISNTNKPLTPNWIGRTYSVPQSVPATSNVPHASPRAHWRRGHWKRVVVGARREGRKWAWIEPTLVNMQGDGELKDAKTG